MTSTAVTTFIQVIVLELPPIKLMGFVAVENIKVDAVRARDLGLKDTNLLKKK